MASIYKTASGTRKQKTLKWAEFYSKLCCKYGIKIPELSLKFEKFLSPNFIFIGSYIIKYLSDLHEKWMVQKGQILKFFEEECKHLRKKRAVFILLNKNTGCYPTKPAFMRICIWPMSSHHPENLMKHEITFNYLQQQVKRPERVRSESFCKYLSSWSHISANMRDNDSREKQEQTLGSEELSPQIFSPGVHMKILTSGYPPFLCLMCANQL